MRPNSSKINLDVEWGFARVGYDGKFGFNGGLNYCRVGAAVVYGATSIKENDAAVERR